MDWIITDPDTGQQYQQLDDRIFRFMEYRYCPDPYHYDSIIDLDTYTIVEKAYACATFGYDLSELENNGDFALIAECIFELE